MRPILLLAASLFLGTCAHAGEAVLVKSDNTTVRLPQKGNAQMQVETMVLPKPAPKVVVQPKPEGAAHPVTKITVPAHLREPLVEVEAYIGNDKHGYWPIDEMGNVSMSGWKSSITGGMA